MHTATDCRFRKCHDVFERSWKLSDAFGRSDVLGCDWMRLDAFSGNLLKFSFFSFQDVFVIFEFMRMCLDVFGWVWMCSDNYIRIHFD